MAEPQSHNANIAIWVGICISIFVGAGVPTLQWALGQEGGSGALSVQVHGNVNRLNQLSENIREVARSTNTRIDDVIKLVDANRSRGDDLQSQISQLALGTLKDIRDTADELAKKADEQEQARIERSDRNAEQQILFFNKVQELTGNVEALRGQVQQLVQILRPASGR